MVTVIRRFVFPLVLVVLLLPACDGGGVSVRIVLTSTTMVAGSELSGKIVVTNDTGHPLHVDECGSPFQVALANGAISPAVAWPRCLQHLTIPTGTSDWAITVLGRYSGCHQGAESDEGPVRFPRCVDDGLPSLSPGTYRATLFQEPRVAPDPDPIVVHVTP